MAVNLGPAPTNVPITDPRAGILTQQWFDYMNRLDAALLQVQAIANNAFGTNYLALSAQPSLNLGDAGYVMFVTDYSHLVYWDGSAWQWLDGDRPLRFDGFSADPGVGWGLCDGTAYTYLVVGGAALTTSSFTTPDLKSTPAYLKSGATYSGTISAASGTTGTGSTGTGTTGTGTTGTGTTGTGTTGTDVTGTGTTGTGTSGNDGGIYTNITASGAIQVAVHPHTHSVPGLSVPALSIPGLSVPGLSVPGLSVPGLSVPALSVPALAVGSIDVARMTTLPYVRR